MLYFCAMDRFEAENHDQYFHINNGPPICDMLTGQLVCNACANCLQQAYSITYAERSPGLEKPNVILGLKPD